MKPDDLKITSAGDLEVVLLSENHSLLADIISPNYYLPVGSPPYEVRFHNLTAFWNFLVHVDELFAEGPENVHIAGRRCNLSLFEAAEWFSKTFPVEAEAARLCSACAHLRDWIDTCPAFGFWSGVLGSQIEFNLSRCKMIHFAANLRKHKLLRLGRLMRQIRGLCAEGGYTLPNNDVIAVREPFIQELESRLLYLSSWLVELLGAYFLAVNSVVAARYDLNSTNDARKIHMPSGVTSGAIRDLYGSVLVFQDYRPERITAYTPVVQDWLKRRY
jgi:hypothetical protein